MNGKPRTRFAPSPTGYLHRGHLLSALWVWGAALRFGYSVHLRIEDHDKGRTRPEYVTAIREDLKAFGFRWDSESIQSGKEGLYRKDFELLRGKGLLYACDCTRKFLTDTVPMNAEGEVVYQGRCRDRGLPFSAGNAVRFRTPDEFIHWEDLRLGAFDENPSLQCGDFVLRGRTQEWTYQFAVCADDIDENTAFIIRGEDLRNSTARQIALMRALGRSEPPIYLHHGLLYEKNSAAKLSKRQRSASLRAELAGGVSPDALIGSVCHEAGLAKDDSPLSLQKALYIIADRFKADF
jgi:glutamyl-Q tRNA(Asp) synthetase